MIAAVDSSYHSHILLPPRSHVNRIPIDGAVDFFKYRAGGFKAAFREAASHENEQTIVGILQNGRRILVKQIAGILARRIICSIGEGQQVRKGERFGLIKFGSRVDIFLPADVEILVTKGQKARGGITLIGKFKDET